MQTTGPIQTGRKTVGATAVAMSASTSPLNNGVAIKALDENTGVIYVGDTDDVDSSTGFPLAAGDSVSIGVVRPSDIYLIASAADQGVAWIGS